MERYSRNRIYISEEEQERIKQVRILLGGAGIGSIIAECALRFGFENITIVDGDKVEESNLNRQNYVHSDIGKYKAEALSKRLLKINPKAEISFFNTFINKTNVEEIVFGHHIAINALDFKDDTPLVFDQVCSDKKIPVLHPYNFGWAGFLTIVKPKGYQLSEISKDFNGFELKVAEFVSRYGMFWNMPVSWLEDVIDKYRTEGGILPPPQLSVASWIVAGHCVNAMFNLATGKEVKYFPKFYFSSLMCEKTLTNKRSQQFVIGSIRECFCYVLHLHFGEQSPFAGLDRVNGLTKTIGYIVHRIALSRQDKHVTFRLV